MATRVNRPKHPTPPGLAAFMAAIRLQESGSFRGNYREPNGDGAYQILASNWPSWAAAAGFPQWAHGNASSAPPAVQDAVARHVMLGYFFGPARRSWFGVAQAWNGGAGCIGGNCANAAIPGGVNGYARSVIGHMGHAPRGARLRPPPAGGGGSRGWVGGGKVPTVGGVPVSPDPPGIVSCYVRLPKVAIPVPLLPDPKVGGWCLDFFVFGLLTLAGGGGLLVGAALMAKGVGSNAPVATSVVARAREVTKL